jgi:hypothetical protein
MRVESRSKIMKYSQLRLASAVFLLLFSCMMALGQEQMFSDPSVDYTFAIPDPMWKAAVKPSGTNPNVEYVYGDRRDGHLLVRKLIIEPNTILADVVQDEAHNKLQFLPGYVAGKEENFTGKLRGTAFNYEYVAAGHPMAGRIYFLRANDTVVYVLRFNGPKEGLRGLRNQTDQIARTFSVKR